jgi:hypothetical protein
MCVIACCIFANLHLFICVSVPWASVHLHNREPLLGVKPRISCNPSLLCVNLATTKNHRFKYSHVSSCVTVQHARPINVPFSGSYIHHICPLGHVFSLSIHPFIHPSLHLSLLSSLCYPSSIVSVKLILKGQDRIELLRQGRLRISFRNRTIRYHECVSLPSSFSKTPRPSMKCFSRTTAHLFILL